MFLLIALSALVCAQINAAYGSQSNYNNFNKHQYQNIQSQAFGAHNYQHQTHHTPQFQPQQNAFQQQNTFQSNRNVIPITSYKNEMNPDGSYQYSYSTGNGIKADETGYLKNRGSQNQAQVAQGSYSYTAPNGQLIQVSYIADENGFRAEGNHLPTPPPIPKAIAESLQLIARTQPAPATHNYQHQQYNHDNSGQYNHNQHHGGHNYGK